MQYHYQHWTDIYCLCCNSEWRVAGLELVSGSSCICYLSLKKERKWLMHQHIDSSYENSDSYVVLTVNNFVMITLSGGVSSVMDLGPFIVPRF